MCQNRGDCGPVLAGHIYMALGWKGSILDFYVIHVFVYLRELFNISRSPFPTVVACIIGPRYNKDRPYWINIFRGNWCSNWDFLNALLAYSVQRPPPGQAVSPHRVAVMQKPWRFHYYVSGPSVDQTRGWLVILKELPLPERSWRNPSKLDPIGLLDRMEISVQG